MDIQWEAPPADAVFRHENKGGKYVEFALALRARPGDWALMPSEAATSRASAAGLAQNIRRGATKGFAPKGSYDAIYSFDEESGVPKVHVRFLGEEGVAAAARRDAAPEPAGAAGNGSDDDPPARSNGGARAWARANGWPDIPERGRLPEGVLDAYEQHMAREADAD